MKKIKGFEQAKIFLVIFSASLGVGVLLGLVFQQLRITSLAARQKVQKVEEEKRLNMLFEKFSQVKSTPTKINQ